MPTHHLSVSRTARICTTGDPSAPEWWVGLHGYGETADGFLEKLRPVASPGRFVMAPEALSRFYTDRMTEHRTAGASWMTRRDREYEIADYVAYLDDAAAHFRPPDGTVPRITVLGFSQGTATASRWALLGNTPVDRLILWGGDLAADLDLERHLPALRQMNLTAVVGTSDRYVTRQRRDALQQRAADHDVSLTLHTFDGGHRLDDEVLRKLLGDGGEGESR